MGFVIAHDGISDVKRSLEPFVPVRNPGICPLNTFGLWLQAPICPRPEPESAIHVKPSVRAAGNFDLFCKGIECTRVDLAGLGDDYFWPFSGYYFSVQVIGFHASFGIGVYANDAVMTQTKILECRKYRGMGVVAYENMNFRGPKQAIGVRIPAMCTVNLATRSR